ncbi:hypothetical protein K2X85_02515 [bacterium]|nr:hypothetical protein [bacterium]
MTLSGPDHFPEPASEAIPWIRKRDGLVVPFDPGKLASSIFAAVESLHYDNPGFVTQELAPPVIHFLVERIGNDIPTSDEVGETVIKVLKQLDHVDVAQAYAKYADRRGKLRAELRIVPDSTAGTRPDRKTSTRAWEKARLIERLEGEADLDSITAREVAAAIERRILAIGLDQLTSVLIDELVYCEFLDRGIQRPWARRWSLSIPRDSLREIVSQQNSPASVLRQAGHQVLREYSLRDVFSRDVAALVDEQMLLLLGQPSPVHWSAISLPVVPLAVGRRSIDVILDRWEESVDLAAEQASSAIAIDGLDAVLARLASAGDQPERVATRVARHLESFARRYPVHWIVNLFGSVPADFSHRWLKESLFDDRPPAEQDQWARTFGEALLTQMHRIPSGAGSIRIDMHLDAMMPTEHTDQLVRQMLRGAIDGLAVGFAFDRPTWSTGEGLFAAPDHGFSTEPGSGGNATPSVIEYVGIDLSRLLDRLGGEDDGHLFLRRLDLLCDSAVRLALQKREHLRTRLKPREVPDKPWGMANSHEGSLVLCPVGLESVVRRMTGADGLWDEAGSAMAERIVRRMLHRSNREAKPYRLSCHIDSVPGEHPVADLPSRLLARRSGGSAILGSMGRLHAAMSGGTALLRLPASPSMDDLARLVVHSLSDATLCRLVLAPSPTDVQPRLFD